MVANTHNFFLPFTAPAKMIGLKVLDIIEKCQSETRQTAKDNTPASANVFVPRLQIPKLLGGEDWSSRVCRKKQEFGVEDRDTRKTPSPTNKTHETMKPEEFIATYLK
ncbi:hypothetical protein OS493_005520 [Desmophyllum pertusum]|uniref:Uncharacterized protein n=1 Tax=Desmophyllum pertusum TaxID=174260 RepID=A0A9X0CNR0_9CNID|nr:hypothetical protein OS493_005520 [Desmophyllum pertusum]